MQGKEEQIILDLVRRCNISGDHRKMSLKMQLLDTLFTFNSANWHFKQMKEQLADHPMMEAFLESEYEELSTMISNATEYYCTHPYDEENDKKYSKHITQYLFNVTPEDPQEEALNQTRLLVDLLQSDKYIRIEILKEGIKLASKELRQHLEDIGRLLRTKWSDDKYVSLEKAVEKQYSPSIKAFDSAFKYFTRWKNDGFEDPEEYEALLRNELLKLFDNTFLIVEEDHLPSSYKGYTKLFSNFVEKEEQTSEQVKKFFLLTRIVGFENGRFAFNNEEALGRYLFRHRWDFSYNDLEAFYYFKRMCGYIYSDLDSKGSSDTNVDSVPAKPVIPDGYTAFTMKVDDVVITESQLREFLISLPKKIKFDKQDGLALYDVMIIHGLSSSTIGKKVFVDDVNKLAGTEILSYNSCKNNDDLEFHKKISEWQHNEISIKHFKTLANYNKRLNLAKSIESDLLNLKLANKRETNKRTIYTNE